MTKGSDLIKQFRAEAKKDHIGNIKIVTAIFLSWGVIVSVAAILTHQYWDKSLLGLMGFLGFWYLVFVTVVLVIEKNGEAIRQRRKQEERLKAKSWK